LFRRYGRFDYVCTIERHKSGYPHLNVLVFSQGLFGECLGDGWKMWRSERGWGGQNVPECGFGFRLWAEPVRDYDAMCGYLVKICRETAKVEQLPVNAPKHFRRIRASRGLLPPVYKSLDVTGGLVKQPVDVAEQLVKKLDKSIEFRIIRSQFEEVSLWNQSERILKARFLFCVKNAVESSKMVEVFRDT
jgi:hypothetical protein